MQYLHHYACAQSLVLICYPQHKRQHYAIRFRVCYAKCRDYFNGMLCFMPSVVAPSEPNAIKIQGSVITGSCKYRKNLQDPVVFKMNEIGRAHV